jgi:hypothetical protein
MVCSALTLPSPRETLSDREGPARVKVVVPLAGPALEIGAGQRHDHLHARGPFAVTKRFVRYASRSSGVPSPCMADAGTSYVPIFAPCANM